MENNTLKYYDENAHDFIVNTVSVDFTATQDKFLHFLQPKSHILDFGCGSGRDSKYFLKHGFKVTAIDGSSKLCKFASAFTGIKVKQMYFQNLDAFEVYDGVWACASILHLDYNELQDVLYKINRALKTQGFFYTSFKYGDFSGERNGRYFTDLNEQKLSLLLADFPNFVLQESWLTQDVRPNREEEKWLNIILRKI